MDLTTIFNSPSTGRPAMMACGWTKGPITAAHITSQTSAHALSWTAHLQWGRGAQLTQALLAVGIDVGEVRPPARSSRALTGKSDPIDAEAAARSVLGRPREQVMEPRAAGTRAAIRILLASRSLLDHQRTANRNALTALLRGTDLGIDARSSLRDAQISTIAAWRSSNVVDPMLRIARAEAKRLASAVKDLTIQLAENHKELAQLTEELAPGLQSVAGVGPVTGAIIICAYSHHGRIRSEAAFAALGGVAPRPASSGNTTRHRLNRSGAFLRAAALPRQRAEPSHRRHRSLEHGLPRPHHHHPEQQRQHHGS